MRATFRIDISERIILAPVTLDPHDESHSYRFCPRCAGPLAPRATKAGEPPRPACERCGYILYVDPKVAVGTIIRTHGSRLVMVRRAIEPGYGKWVFPGGYVDRGEPLTVAARREAREECGLEVQLDHLINVYSYSGSAPVIIVYAATALSGTLRVDDECLEAAECDSTSIPWGELAFKSTDAALRDYFNGVRHPIALDS
jgi:8-oxo-dGTP diphosphatase